MWTSFAYYFRLFLSWIRCHWLFFIALLFFYWPYYYRLTDFGAEGSCCGFGNLQKEPQTHPMAKANRPTLSTHFPFMHNICAYIKHEPLIRRGFPIPLVSFALSLINCHLKTLIPALGLAIFLFPSFFFCPHEIISQRRVTSTLISHTASSMLIGLLQLLSSPLWPLPRL